MLADIKDLSKIYKQQHAVKKISFQIENGKCTALLGPNGAGKTTTLQMLAGLLTPTSGRIQFLNSKGQDTRQLIGFLPQHPAFFSWMTAKEFLHFVGKLSNIPKKQLAAKITKTLEFVSLLEVQHKKIGGFSGGMKQRLGLAQALLHDPALLILDEPVSALDPNGRRDVLKILDQLKSKMTILFSTHVLHDAEQICDDVIMLKDGEIQWDGSIASLKKNNSAAVIMIKTEQPLKSLLESAPGLTNIEYKDSNHAILHFQDTVTKTQDILRILVDNHLTLTHFERLQDSLEDAYMRVMNR